MSATDCAGLSQISNHYHPAPVRTPLTTFTFTRIDPAGTRYLHTVTVWETTDETGAARFPSTETVTIA